MTTTLANALNQALIDQMSQDSRVIVAGQDIGENGGVFRITDGLLSKFGPARVIDTPISEAFQAGFAVGLALAGMRPVMEFQFMGFIYAALDQIISHASRMRNRTRGHLTCPAVFRAPYGGYVHAPEHHSESVEALFAHIPGLRVIIPSSPHLGYHLLTGAIQCEDPVIFLEPKRLYRCAAGSIDMHQPPAFGKAHVAVSGTDLTLITWGAMLTQATEIAMQYRHRYGIEIEVIDLSSLKPIDHDTLVNSVNKTGRALVLHEACQTGGLGAEIATSLQERATGLLTPPLRIAGLDIIPPYYQNEKYFFPSNHEIYHAINRLLES